MSAALRMREDVRFPELPAFLVLTTPWRSFHFNPHTHGWEPNLPVLRSSTSVADHGQFREIDHATAHRGLCSLGPWPFRAV